MDVLQEKDKAEMGMHKTDLRDGIKVEVLVVCKNSSEMDIAIGIELDELNRQEERKTENEPTRPEAEISDSNALDKSDCEMIVRNNDGSLDEKSINGSEGPLEGETLCKTPAKDGRKELQFLKHVEDNSSKVKRMKNALDQIRTLDIVLSQVVQEPAEGETLCCACNSWLKKVVEF
ncbi:hypothetical protein C2G38_2028615 [Gigaspora rosea]|uniref:Uncharacterized protein n=1 Tax=Gigaspora rosea TaxID=44941 RepID=A0A397W7T1_9GLOM|nr:hypothetical protein C2G38_2028615 [Gigaspora rosea]